MKIQLSIIIINFNVKYFLEHCLNSVLQATANIPSEIIVVDNCSTDGSKKYFRNRFSNVNFFWNDSNSGFARANNMGLRQSSGDYILFLNPDTLLAEDSLEKCIDFLQAKNNQAALGVKMIDGSGKFLRESKRSFPHPHTSLFKIIGLARLFPRSRIFGRYHMGHLNENENHPVEVLAGAFMLLPRNILEIVKGFDEDFFMYGEDIDLSYRIRQAGFENYYFAGTTIIHFKGESTKKGSLNYVRMFYLAMDIFVRKHYRSRLAGLSNLFIRLAIGIRGIMAAAARFLRSISLPVIDVNIIFLSFYAVIMGWNKYIRQHAYYSSNELLPALFTLTGLFLLTSWLTGLYDNPYKLSRLIRSTIFSILVILTLYLLLPENFRFPPGILLSGLLLVLMGMAFIRTILIRRGVTEKIPGSKETVIIGNAEDYKEVLVLLKKAGHNESLPRRVRLSEQVANKSLADLSDLQAILQSNTVKQIIFCYGQFTLRKIISLLPGISPNIRFRFYAAGLNSIIGSDDSNVAGNYISHGTEGFHLLQKAYKREKRLLDIIVSSLILALFPLLLFLKKRPLTLIRNAMNVLVAKKTWVGYSGSGKDLPEIKKGIITTAGLKNNLSMPTDGLDRADHLYAKCYRAADDILLIRKNYRKLS